MKIIGFVGPSGTGKSHHALVVAYDEKIEAIIDDGLLIYRNRIVAGHSAKDETNYMKAVKTAIFSNKEDAAAMRGALRRIKTDRLLILGTSKHMIERIVAVLQLPAPARFITIEEVSTPEDMVVAREQRVKEGRHIIPVPTMELKSHFHGYLLDSVRSLFNRSGGKESSEFEHSVVRPVFSYYGKLVFSDAVLLSLVRHTTSALQGVVKINKIRIRKNRDSRVNGLRIDLTVTVRYGENLKKLTAELRRAVEKEVAFTTGMGIDVLQVTIKDVVAE